MMDDGWAKEADRQAGGASEREQWVKREKEQQQQQQPYNGVFLMCLATLVFDGLVELRHTLAVL